MPDTRKLRARRNKLWAEDPHCRQCGVLTVLPQNTRNHKLSNLATIEHIYSKLNPKRLIQPEVNEIRRILLCQKCNLENAAKDCEVNFPEIHRERSVRNSLTSLKY